MRALLDGIRVLAGDYSARDTLGITAKKVSELQKHEQSSRGLLPSVDQIAVVRIQLQHILNPESRFMQPPVKLRGGKSLHEQDEARLLEFINDSRFWADLIRFEETLSEVADQSYFYFKEIQLDLNSVVQFPVRSSLPFILCQYALDNYNEPELTELIFYSLAIYNDAAFVAQNVHKSRLMVDEIRAESRVCVDTLAVLIGEFTFNAFRAFATLRQLPHETAVVLRKFHQKHWPQSRGYRLVTLLQQNEYVLLSQQISLVSLIAARVDQELCTAVQSLYQLANDFGLIAALAISRSVAIVQETHKLLADEGLPLMPFVDIDRTAKGANLPTAFASKYGDSSVAHLFKVLARKYALMLSPLRLVPPKKLQLPAESFGKAALGRILKDTLEHSVAFLSVHHFVAFISQIGEGALVMIARQLKGHVEASMDRFIALYNRLAGRLSRINDAPFGTSAHAAFTRYEAAYTFFVDDSGIAGLLRVMQSIGNAVAIAEMMDQALTERKMTSAHLYTFVTKDAGQLFDQDFRDKLAIIAARPSGRGDREHVLLSLTIDTFIAKFADHVAAFEEVAPKRAEMTAMVGFAARWSVIEFLYCLIESQRTGDPPSGFVKHGLGVWLCAALILLATDQVSVYRSVAITRKMKRYTETDMTGMIDEKVLRFKAVADLGMAAGDWGCEFLRPFTRLVTTPEGAEPS
jgi:hypothetical protein